MYTKNLTNLKSLREVELSLRGKVKIYLRSAKEIEDYLSKNPDEWGKFQSEFDSVVNGIFKDIMDFERVNINTSNKEKVDKLKHLFINRIRKIFLKGNYNEWSFRKPYGYAGDFKIIDDIYQNNPKTMGFARLFDNYFMMSAISVAVRNRKEDFKRLIIDFANKNQEHKIRIMNLACGSCRDVKEIMSSDQLVNKNIIFDCYDQDIKALEYAKNLLNDIPDVNFVQENALRIGVTKNLHSLIKFKYDLIYSTGLFDYLNYRISERLISNLRKILNPNGLLIVSDVRDKYSNPSVHYMEWVGDWNLLYRDDNEFRKIFYDSGFCDNELKSLYEQQGIMQYMSARKLKR